MAEIVGPVREPDEVLDPIRPCASCDDEGRLRRRVLRVPRTADSSDAAVAGGRRQPDPPAPYPSTNRLEREAFPIMNHRSIYRTAVLALSALGSAAGHETGDYLVQSDCDAQRKQQRTPAGRRSLARHAATYALSQAVTRAALYRTAGLRVPFAAQLAGAVVEGAAHAVIDDGRLLRRYAEAIGKGPFHDLAAGGINGRALLDQAAHKGLQIPLGALVTTLVAARRGR